MLSYRDSYYWNRNTARIGRGQARVRRTSPAGPISEAVPPAGPSDVWSIIRSRIRMCNEPFLRAKTNRGLAAITRRERKGRQAWERKLSRPADPKTRFAAGGFRFRWERDSWAGAEP